MARLWRVSFWQVLLLLAGALVIAQVYWFNWKLDDAYISFAYARNWVEGKGIVFNEGERVEGYTCFLWVALIALGLWLHLPVEPWSTVLGTVCALGSLLTAAALAHEVLPQGRRWAAAGAALLAALWPPFAWWAASGMETTLFAFLVTASLWAHVRTAGSSPWVGVVAALAALTRPEAWLLGGLLAADAIRLQRRKGVWVGLTFLAIFGTYFAWRTWYYGYLLPNTFYAKVGTTTEQIVRGWVYLKSFLWNWGACLFLTAWLPVVTAHRRRLLVVYAFIALYAAYVVVVGGDVFHFFRFWVPLFPALCALSYAGILHVNALAPSWQDRIALGAIVGLLCFWLAWTTRVSLQEQSQHAIVARNLRNLGFVTCRCLQSKTAPGDSVASLGIGVIKWCTNLRVIDMLGLTDLHIARHAQVRMGAGLAGHEKYDSKYVLSRKPEYILVSPLVPGAKRIVLPAERDMWAQPEFLMHYEKDECGYRRKHP